MDPRFPSWYLAAAIQPKDEFLRKRWAAVEDVASGLTPQGALELVRLFHDRPLRDAAFLGTLESTAQNSDAAFTATAPGPEVAVLAGATLALLSKRQSQLADLAALATVTPFCRGAGSKGTVPDIIAIQQHYLTTRAQQQRSVPPASTTELSPLDDDVHEEQPNPATLAAVATAVNQVIEVVTYLESQQRLFREESNVLWWINGGHSRDDGRAFSEVGLPAACIVAGKELADLAATNVGPFAAPAFLDRVLKSADSPPENVQISAAVNSVDGNLLNRWQEILSSPALDLCPILLGLNSRSKSAGRSWTAAYKTISTVAPSAKLTPLDLSTQVYEEAMLLKSIRETQTT